MKYRPGTVVGFFLYNWLTVGFFTGTLVLLGPVRWVTGGLRANAVSQLMENVVVALLILLFVVGSALIARWVTRRMLSAESRWARVAVPALATAFAGVALWGWLNPGTWGDTEQVALERVHTAAGAQFVFGPYPDEQRLRELKRAGFTGVVSLLHPAVVPFEPKILGDERENADRVGLRLIHAPMLPWVGDNDESLATIRRLAADGGGRYYVHCYLGRDRVNAVKRVLASTGAQVAGALDLERARGFEERDEPFERGPLVELAEDVWLVPYPNRHELFGYLLFGNVGHALLLLDPADPRQAPWIDEARELLDGYAVRHSFEPLVPGDTARALALAGRVAGLDRPVAIVVPFTESEDGGDPRVAELFRYAFERQPAPASSPRAPGRPGTGAARHGVAEGR